VNLWKIRTKYQLKATSSSPTNNSVPLLIRGHYIQYQRNIFTPIDHTLNKSITKTVTSIPNKAYTLIRVAAPTIGIPLLRAIKANHINIKNTLQVH